jgi:hypothetical protein
MKDTIVELKQTVKDAAARHNQAKQDTKRIEKDMNEFANNKDSKLKQLQVQLDGPMKLTIETSGSVESGSQETRCNYQSPAQGIPDAAIRERYVHGNFTNRRTIKRRLDRSKGTSRRSIHGNGSYSP